jgi:hypothetical protein
MQQIIREISNETKLRIETQRDWVRNHYDADSLAKYDSFYSKLELLDTIIKSNWIQKDEKYKLQCLGVTFGDALVQGLNFNWIEIEDDSGTDPALKLGDTSIILFPLTMISKRIENDENIDVFELFEKIKLSVIELKDKVDKNFCA